jgi:endonuclease/exonuclease/phosphatase family metal-dependent hydrolase
MSGFVTDDWGMEGNLGRPLSVLTWNTSYEPLQPLGVLPWPERRDRIAEVTRDADLIALQELAGRQLRDIQQLLPSFEVVTTRIPLPRALHRTLSRRYGATLERDIGELALLVRTARLEVIERGHQWLSPTPSVPLSIGWGNVVPRLLLWSVLYDRSLEARVVAATTYVDLTAVRPMLSAIRDGLVEPVERAGAGILLGDLNTMADPDALDVLLAAGWHDTHPSRDLGIDPTFLGDLAGRPGRIDHILVYGRAAAAGWRHGSAARDGLSDHVAVRAEVRLEQDARPDASL